MACSSSSSAGRPPGPGQPNERKIRPSAAAPPRRERAAALGRNRPVSFLLSVAQWLGDPSHWQGTDGIPTRVGEHLLMSGVALLLATLIALPVGVLIGHSGRG